MALIATAAIAGCGDDQPGETLDGMPGETFDGMPVLPRVRRAPRQGELELATRIRMADVLFLTDNTGSMGGTITTLKGSLSTVIAPALMSEIPSVALGAALFRDFPVSPFGGALGACPEHSGHDEPFRLVQRITTVLSDALLVTIRAMGDGVALLDEVDVHVIVPARS